LEATENSRSETTMMFMKKFPIDYLEPYEKSAKYLNVIVETPKGSRVKYAYEKKKGMFIISKVLPEGMVFLSISVLFPEHLRQMGIHWTYSFSMRNPLFQTPC
jgi:inorganic pyrophosphatase